MAMELLIADDSDFMRNLLREILKESFDIVGEAENGVEAVELYKQLEPDLVMMDIVMPIRDGIAATAEIKDIDTDARVLVCTAVDQEEKREAAVEAGADCYITKPFQKPSLMKAIDDVT
jgi:two-component system chemotaxis response regulator CheY